MRCHIEQLCWADVPHQGCISRVNVYPRCVFSAHTPVVWLHDQLPYSHGEFLRRVGLQKDSSSSVGD